MSEVLVIRLGSHYEDAISWMIWSQVEQEIIASGDIDGAKSLTQLSEKAQSRQVKVLVPACDVTMKTVTLPGKVNRQVLAALPFMLEDDLTQDVDELFFAHGQKTQINGQPAIEVAIVAHQVMSAWISWLEAADIHTTIMVPDALCLPSYDDGVAAIELGQHWLLRHDNWQCAAIDNQWFGQYIQLCAEHFKAKNGDEASQSRLRLVCFSPLDVGDADVDITDEDRQLPLQLLASHIDDSGFNLRQGQYAKKKESSQLWKTWRVAATIAISAIVLQLVYRGAVLWQLDNELSAQKATYLSQYKKAFPGERIRPQLIERQLKKRLSAVAGGADGSETFLTMLDKVAPLFAQSGGFKPDIIKYDDKRQELRLNAIADGYQSFEKFKTAVEGLGYEVHQGSLSNNAENKVTGVITIKGA